MEQPMQAKWTPTPFNLLGGNPFPYSEQDISVISATEAFETAIDCRDKERCVVCGDDVPVEHAHIIPKTEPRTWNEMRKRGFIPRQAKSVLHEPRNGMLLCGNHRWTFDHHYFYIRWVPEAKRFVLINYSRRSVLEPFHGRAIDIRAGNHLPFHGAFLVHEMRVRGHWPFCEDRPISLPIPWPKWAPRNGGDDHDDKDNDDDDQNTTTPVPVRHSSFAPFSANAGTGQQPKTFTPTNPFSNPAELQLMKDSFAKQPNWKAAVIEGETWEGTAEENINKWQELMGPSRVI